MFRRWRERFADGEWPKVYARPPPVARALWARARRSHGEDFADSAEDCGVKYAPLLQKIMTLGLSYDPRG